LINNIFLANETHGSEKLRIKSMGGIFQLTFASLLENFGVKLCGMHVIVCGSMT